MQPPPHSTGLFTCFRVSELKTWSRPTPKGITQILVHGTKKCRFKDFWCCQVGKTMNHLCFKHLPAEVQPKRRVRWAAFLLYYNTWKVCPKDRLHHLLKLSGNMAHTPSSEKNKEDREEVSSKSPVWLRVKLKPNNGLNKPLLLYYRTHSFVTGAFFENNLFLRRISILPTHPSLLRLRAAHGQRWGCDCRWMKLFCPKMSCPRCLGKIDGWDKSSR